MNIVVVTMVALFTSITAPVLLVFLTGKQRRADDERAAERRHTEKVEDWARQDAVAARLLEAQAASAAKAEEVARKAAEAAELLLGAQTESIVRTDEVARIAAEAQASTEARLVEIHGLVNSDMTAARQGQLDQAKMTLVTLRRVVDLGQERGIKPTDADLADIAAAEASIKDLELILADRLAALHANEQATARVAEASAREGTLGPDA